MLRVMEAMLIELKHQLMDAVLLMLREEKIEKGNEGINFFTSMKSSGTTSEMLDGFL